MSNLARFLHGVDSPSQEGCLLDLLAMHGGTQCCPWPDWVCVLLAGLLAMHVGAVLGLIVSVCSGFRVGESFSPGSSSAAAVQVVERLG